MVQRNRLRLRSLVRAVSAARPTFIGLHQFLVTHGVLPNYITLVSVIKDKAEMAGTWIIKG